MSIPQNEPGTDVTDQEPKDQAPPAKQPADTSPETDASSASKKMTDDGARAM